MADELPSRKPNQTPARERLQYLLIVVVILASVATAFAWNDDRPDGLIWGLRIGLTLFGVLALVLLLRLRGRPDLAHDYLRDYVSNYYNRDGFCFAFSSSTEQGVAFLQVYFQNQYGKRSVGLIALRPARGMWLTRARIDTFRFRIPCPPAGFGVARLAVPIPKNLQGTRLSFEVGASVAYPAGKGKQLRFRDGLSIGANTDFEDNFGTALTIAGAAAGALVLTTPAKLTIDLPTEVASDLPDDATAEVTTLWKYGDPPLQLEVQEQSR